MIPDWTRLQPNRSLGPSDPRYVERPGSAAVSVAEWVRSGKATVLLAGAAGIGKSTELAHAASDLQSERVACLVPLDRYENMRNVTADAVRLRIAGRLAEVAIKALGLELSQLIRAGLLSQGVLEPDLGPSSGVTGHVETSPSGLLRLVIKEVRRLARQQRIALLIDGVEKCTEPEQATPVIEALSEVPPEVDLVVIAPWHMAYGPRADQPLRESAKLVMMLPLEVNGKHDVAGQTFFQLLIARRLGLSGPHDLPEAFWKLVDSAAGWSGGIPRMFLQLLADAASHARLGGRGALPEEEHLEAAVADQRDSWRRLLLPGDSEALEAVHGADGRNLALDKKIRLMSHGILLERRERGFPVMRAHPIVQQLLDLEDDI